ncbi:CHRD domain-containing protein [Clavibacter capsici]|uniref:CHRD domain-containing protein n=1 Tax=Clavibacter capsici TaxID=1874630 RepID=UPI00287B7320|nr:CHRD domain-containing protein [Clavibacter capsici]
MNARRPSCVCPVRSGARPGAPPREAARDDAHDTRPEHDHRGRRRGRPHPPRRDARVRRDDRPRAGALHERVHRDGDAGPGAQRRRRRDPGEPGATGRFDLRLDSTSNTICYDITLTGVTGEYQSPAKTATHIHQAAVGKAGPPRIAFPNPTDSGNGTRTSSGCMQGPFTTGVAPDGKDTGEGFTVAQIEADPSAFAADTHTASFTAGAVRGQLTQVPVGGVDTGAGGSATSTSPALPFVAGGGAVALAAAGVVLMRRHRAQES